MYSTTCCDCMKLCILVTQFSRVFCLVLKINRSYFARQLQSNELNCCTRDGCKIGVYRVVAKLMYTGWLQNWCIQGGCKIDVYRVVAKLMYTGWLQNCCIQSGCKIDVYRVVTKLMYTGWLQN